MMAARKFRVEALECLLKNNADKTLKNNQGDTAIDIARKFRFKKVELLLLKVRPKRPKLPKLPK